MILPNEVTKKIEECCVKIDNLEKALEYAKDFIGDSYARYITEEEVENAIKKINRIKEEKEE